MDWPLGGDILRDGENLGFRWRYLNDWADAGAWMGKAPALIKIWTLNGDLYSSGLVMDTGWTYLQVLAIVRSRKELSPVVVRS